VNRRIAHWLVAAGLAFFAAASWALPVEVVHDLAFGEGDERAKAIGTLVASGDAAALPLLQAMIDGEVQTVGDKTVLIVKGNQATDAMTGQAVTPLPENREDVVVNNRMRKTLATAIAAFRLSSPDRAARLAAAKELQNTADEEALPAIAAALAKEADPEIKGLLTLTQAQIQLAAPIARRASERSAPSRKATPAPPRPCSSACSKRRTASSSSPTKKCARKRSARSRLSRVAW
jgi:urea transport system permease protein